MMVEPVDKRVLIDQPATHIFLGGRDRKRPVAPRAVGEHDTAQAPVATQLLEIEVRPHPGQRDVFDTRPFEATIDLFIFVPPLLGVPSGQTVFDLAIGASVLFEDDHQRATRGQDLCYFGTGGGRSDYRYYMARSHVHAFTQKASVLTKRATYTVPEVFSTRNVRARIGAA